MSEVKGLVIHFPLSVLFSVDEIGRIFILCQPNFPFLVQKHSNYLERVNFNDISMITKNPGVYDEKVEAVLFSMGKDKNASLRQMGPNFWSTVQNF